MSTLFLIGNGFDLNCGMKTRYTDVYNEYIKEKSRNNVIARFKETISNNFDDWGDFEMAVANYAKNFHNEKEFLECIRDFTVFMERYLIQEEGRFKKEIDMSTIKEIAIKEIAESFSTFYMGISHNIDNMMKARNAENINRIEVISFNYTDVFDTIFSDYSVFYTGYEKGVIHIHGILNDDPVLGVDNIGQISTLYNITKKGERNLVKPVFNNAFDQYRVRSCKKLINNANTICIYGMSLGESDLTWRNEIINWLKKDKQNQLFIYKYSLSKIQFRTVGEKMDIEEDEKEKLLVDWGVEDNNPIFDQIHIPCGKNIFNIGDAIEKNRKEFDRVNNEKIAKIKESRERNIKRPRENGLGVYI